MLLKNWTIQDSVLMRLAHKRYIGKITNYRLGHDKIKMLIFGDFRVKPLTSVSKKTTAEVMTEAAAEVAQEVEVTLRQGEGDHHHIPRIGAPPGADPDLGPAPMIGIADKS